MCWHFACLLLTLSTLRLFAALQHCIALHCIALLKHCQCFPHEDVCLLLTLGSLSRNTVPGAGSVLYNMVPVDHPWEWWENVFHPFPQTWVIRDLDWSSRSDNFFNLIISLFISLGWKITHQNSERKLFGPKTTTETPLSLKFCRTVKWCEICWIIQWMVLQLYWTPPYISQP